LLLEAKYLSAKRGSARIYLIVIFVKALDK